MVFLMAPDSSAVPDSDPMFDPDSVVPLYEQAAEHVAAQIQAGKLVAGQRLPAERDLADQWGIGYQTVRRAMRELRERGLIVSRIGKGTFVA
jgi:DNA-binding GntR family transcriptional regulator